MNRVALTIQPSSAPEQYYIAVGADPSRIKPHALVQGGTLNLSHTAAGVGYGGQVTVGCALCAAVYLLLCNCTCSSDRAT